MLEHCGHWLLVVSTENVYSWFAIFSRKSPISNLWTSISALFRSLIHTSCAPNLFLTTFHIYTVYIPFLLVKNKLILIAKNALVRVIDTPYVCDLKNWAKS